MTTLTSHRIVNTMTDEQLIEMGLLVAAQLEPIIPDEPMTALIVKQLALRYRELLKRRA